LTGRKEEEERKSESLFLPLPHHSLFIFKILVGRMVITASPSLATRQDSLRYGAAWSSDYAKRDGASRACDNTARNGATGSGNNACHFDFSWERRGFSWVRIELERKWFK